MSISSSLFVSKIFVVSYFFLTLYLANENYGDSSAEANLIPSENECNSSLCNECSTYPEKEIQMAVETGDDCLKQNMSNPASSTEKKNSTNAEEEDNDEEEFLLCTTEDKVIQPKVGKTITGKMRYIVQTSEVNQKLTVQVCQNPEKECNYIEGCVKGYKSVCQQNYAYRKFTVLNTHGELKQEIFEIEAGCICKLFKAD